MDSKFHFIKIFDGFNFKKAIKLGILLKRLRALSYYAIISSLSCLFTEISWKNDRIPRNFKEKIIKTYFFRSNLKQKNLIKKKTMINIIFTL